MVSVDDDERQDAILTKAYRAYLRGEKDYTEKTEVNTRVRIRDRIKHALADFDLLVNNLTPNDRRLIFEADGNSTRREFLAEGVVAKDEDRGAGMLEQVVIFVYMVCRDWGLDFEALVERAVRRAETSIWFDGQFERRENVADVDVSIELRRESDIDVEDAMERFEEQEYLSNAEMGALFREGLIDGEDLEEYRYGTECDSPPEANPTED